MKLMMTGVVLLCACAPKKSGPSLVSLSESTNAPDGARIEWKSCPAEQPCVQGMIDGKPYEFGFPDSPSTLVGKIGDKSLSFALDPESIYRLGDHDIELRFLNLQEGLALALSWNERDQRPIGHDILTATF